MEPRYRPRALPRRRRGALQTCRASGPWNASCRWSGTPLHALARQFRTDGRLVPISRLATSAGFRSYDSTIAYPESGSFVRYVIDTRGLDRMRTLFGRLDANSSEAAVTAMVQTIYGESLEALEREWITFLDQI